MTAPESDTALARLVAEIPGAHWVPTEESDGTIGQGAWVPYGPGFEIPLTFDYHGDGLFDWRIWIGVIDGRPQCIRFECEKAGAPVTPEALHRFPLGRMLEEAALLASRPAGEIPRSFERWESVEEVRAARV